LKLTRSRVLVVVLSVIALAIYMPAATEGGAERGSFGLLILRGETLVRSVEPDSAGAQAGIVPGDHIDVAALGISGHLRLVYPRPGQHLTVIVRHGDLTRTVSLTAHIEEKPEVLRWLIFLEFLSVAAFVCVGATLVFLRPAPMTWWLWLFCIGIAPVNELLDYYSFLPDDVLGPAWLVGRTLLGGFSVFPLLPFVLRFPHDRITGWRARARGPAIALVICFFVYYVVIAWRGLTQGLDNYTRLNGAPALVMYAIAAALLIATYLHAHGNDRQRLKWAVTGMIVAFAAQILEYVPGPIYLAPFAEAASVVMPITVAYAVLRHRLVDVEFVVNRAIIYTVLTALLLTFVSLLDWLTSRLISDYHLALYLEAAATIGVGFLLNRLHEALERLTDRVFFRSRHIAERQLDRIARSLIFATRLENIEEALVDEPARWLDLASAAIFRHDDERRVFVRGRSIGWAEENLKEFPDDAPIARYLQAERTALTATSAAWNADDLPVGAAAPALYVPIICRNTLHAIAIYGAHANSSLPDPGEIAMIAQLAPNAGLAFDHVAFEEMSRRLNEVTARLPQITPYPTVGASGTVPSPSGNA
jgi:hypothetical protein